MPDFPGVLSGVVGFDWDEGNSRKNQTKYGVPQAEAEEIFLNEPLVVAEDAAHSVDEQRFHALGRSSGGRLLHATFTLRDGGTLIRIISVRDMSRKERGFYEQQS